MSWRNVDIASLLLTLESGSRPKGGVSTDRGDIPSLGGENVLATGGVTLDNVNLVSTEFYSKMTKGRLQDGDVLINKDGAQTGKVGLYHSPDGAPACINEHLFLLRGMPERVTQEYLYYLLLSDIGQKQIRAETSGSAQPGLKSGFVKKVVTSVPVDIREQSKIAEILTTVDRAIEQTEALIAKQQRIKTGLMHDLLTRGIDEHGNLRSESTHKFKDSPLGRIPVEWDVKAVADTGSVDLGRQLSPKYMKSKTPTPYLRVANVFDGWIDYSDVLEMDFTTVEKAKYMLRQGDVLLNEGQSRELVGRSAIYRGPDNVYCFQNTLIRYRPYANMRSEFAQVVFKLWLDTGVFADVARQTTSVAHLGAGRFAKMLIPNPNEQEQDRILSVFLPADCVSTRYQDSLRKLRRIKTGLMQDLLTGRRRVTALLDQKDEVSA